MDKEKILLITTPHQALLRHSYSPWPSYSVAEIAGGLNYYDFEVYHYDLNAALNDLRANDEIFSEDDIRMLSEKIFDFETCKNNKNLKRISDELVNGIEKRDYKAIGISLNDRWPGTGVSDFCIYIFNMLFFISLSLKETYDIPIHVGGECALRTLSQPYLEEVSDTTLIDTYFMKEAKVIFPRFLKKYKEYDSLFYKQTENELVRVTDIESLPIPSSWNIENKNDLYSNVMEAIPQPIMDKYKELKEIKPFIMGSFRFMLGCPNKCAFCSESSWNRFEILKPTQVVDLLESYCDEDIFNFIFFNNNLNFSEKYVFQLCNEIIKRNVKIQFSDSANLKYNKLEMFQALREAGCVRLWFGGETASQKLLNTINKKMTPDDIYEGLENSDKAGIWNGVNLIVNLPHETEEDFQETEKLSSSQFVDTIYCNIFTLLAKSLYMMEPEKFEVKIRKLTLQSLVSNRKMCEFDEIGGIKWEEREAQGIDRRNRILTGRKNIDKAPIHKQENDIMRDDNLLYSLYRAVEDKKIVKQIFEDILELLTPEELADFKLKL